MPLKVSDGMGAWIHDFKKSDAPQFKGKSEKERRDQAIAAYMAAKKESVTEVSKGTLDRYVSKAIDSHGHAQFSARMSRDDPNLKSYHNDQTKTAEKRRQGINRALDRKAKESVAEGSLEEYGDTARGQKMLTKVHKRAVDRLIKKDDENRKEPDYTKRDLKTVRKHQATADRAWDRMAEEVVAEGTGSLKPGWMLKADPKLGAKVKQSLDRKKHILGKPSDEYLQRVKDDEYERKVTKHLKKKYAKEEVKEAVHRVAVTVSEPNHQAVSQRKEKIQRFVRVTADDRESALQKAQKHYKKLGYKVHNVEHHSVIKEKTQIDEISADLANRYYDKTGDEKRPNPSDFGISRKDARKAHNRIIGANRALDRMYKRNKLKGYKEEVELGEETNFEVSVEGLPKIYMKGKSPGAVKADLRKLLRQQKSILDVQRITPAELKGVFRLKAQGKDEEGGAEMEEATQQNNKPPFEGPYRTAGKPRKDEFGNTIKPKNVAKHLAKKGMKDVKEGSSAALRMYKALQKSKEDRERQERLNKPYADKLLNKKPDNKK